MTHEVRDRILRKAVEASAASVDEGELQVFSLLCHRQVLHYLFAIKTFLQFSGLRCSISVIDDGSLEADDRYLLREEIKSIQVISGLSRRMRRTLGQFSYCRRFFDENIFAKRLFSVYDRARARPFMILDADVLFFRRPAHILAWARGPDRTSIFNKDSCRSEGIALNEADFRSLGTSMVAYFNAGLLCTCPQFLSLDLIEQTLALLYERRPRSPRWVWEQTIWATVIARHPHRALPGSYSFLNDDNVHARVDVRKLISRHYSGVARPDFFGEGVRYLMEAQRF